MASVVERALAATAARVVRPSELALAAIVAGVPVEATRPGTGASVDVVWPAEDERRL